MNDITLSGGQTLERSISRPRNFQDLLNMYNVETALTPPPSYDAVLLQKHFECSLKPTGAPLHSVAECLRELDPLILVSTMEESEKGVQKYLTAFSQLCYTCTVTCARKHPAAIVERVRQFLLHCVARETGVDDLITLSKGEILHFVYLQTAYEWSWLHQIIHGWEDTAHEIRRFAYETFYFFIELPLRQLGVPVSAFLWHARIHRSIYRSFQSSSQSKTTLGYLRSTLQAMRSHSELNRLEELLRMNDMILDSVVDDLHLHPKIFRACKKEIAADRRAYIPPELSANQFQYTMVDHPGWRRFERINRERTSEFAPLRRKADTNGITDRASGTRIEYLPDCSAIQYELEYNPWSPIAGAELFHIHPVRIPPEKERVQRRRQENSSLLPRCGGSNY